MIKCPIDFPTLLKHDEVPSRMLLRARKCDEASSRVPILARKHDEGCLSTGVYVM